jgi:hypothetical protein
MYYPIYLSKKCCGTCEHCLASRELTHPFFGEPKVQINGDPAGCAVDKAISYRGTTPNPTEWKCRRWERCSLVEAYFAKKEADIRERAVLLNGEGRTLPQTSEQPFHISDNPTSPKKEAHPKEVLVAGIIISVLGAVQFACNLVAIIISKGIEAKIDTTTASGVKELAKEQQDDIILWVVGAIGAVVLMVGVAFFIDYARIKKKK